MPDPAEIATALGLIDDSYRRWTGETLAAAAPPGADPVAWLHQDAPFALLAHNDRADPLFFYANGAAQRLFGYSWEQMVGLPSRLSAPEAQRAQRSQFFEQVERDGIGRDYSGIRVTRTGRRFLIENTRVWKLVDADGRRVGLAAMIAAWRDE